LSFSYWIAGYGVAMEHLEMALAGVIILYATAVLTSIKAKMIDEFTLARFGPTEFKMLLALFGLAMMAMALVGVEPADRRMVALGFFALLLVIGVVQLLVGLGVAVYRVNICGAVPDSTEWDITGMQSDASDRQPPAGQ